MEYGRETALQPRRRDRRRKAGDHGRSQSRATAALRQANLPFCLDLRVRVRYKSHPVKVFPDKGPPAGATHPARGLLILRLRPWLARYARARLKGAHMATVLL